MGRPRELTDEERAKLIADGYKPVEVWVKDMWSDDFWRQIEEDCRLIRESDLRNGELEYLDQVASDLWDDFN